MKHWIKLELTVLLLAMCCGLFESCKDKKSERDADIAMIETSKNSVSNKPLSKEFKDYWYAGNAEITSYDLEQARYGELRNGKAVLIYVTEPFVADKQVKADSKDPNNIPVLKLNSTKKYLTGIYPYAIMSSSFYPVHDDQHALKVTFSVQEWCGQVFTQLNNREQYDVRSFSYFESEGDKEQKLEKEVLENELWNKIRINPSALPTGEFNMIPSFEYLRMAHKDLRSYKANVSLDITDGIQTYTISYPELNRVLEIKFGEKFPYTIESWSDSFKGGYGDNAKTMVSKGTKIKTIKTPYWQQNRNKDLYLRDTLGL